MDGWMLCKVFFMRHAAKFFPETFALAQPGFTLQCFLFVYYNLGFKCLKYVLLYTKQDIMDAAISCCP